MATKICPGCNNGVGPRTYQCPNCNHIFKSKIINTPDSNSSNSTISTNSTSPVIKSKPTLQNFFDLALSEELEKNSKLRTDVRQVPAALALNSNKTVQGSPGPGRKQCPNPDCKSFIGAKSSKCKYCEWEFQPKKAVSSSIEKPKLKKGERICLNCDKSFESEDYRVDAHGKIYYEWAYARYCSANCLERSDEVKSEIIIYLFNKFSDNDKNIIIEEINSKEGFDCILQGVFQDKKDEDEDIIYRKTHPIIVNISKPRPSTIQECENLGIEVPVLKSKNKLEEDKEELTNILDLEFDEDEDDED